MVDVVHTEGNGSNSAIVAVLVVVVIALVAFFAYKQGYLGGKDSQPEPTKIEITVPTSNPSN